jgi:site-specific DNA-methyltransferase (adenine-specific)
MELYNDDCFNILPTLKEKSVDLVLVDLPYGQTNCDWDVQIDLEKMWNELKRCCTKNCVYVFFCTTKFGHKLIKSNEKWFRYDLVWEKSIAVGFLSANKMPLRIHEMIYVFKNVGGIYNPQKVAGKPYTSSKNKPCEIYGTQRNITINNTGDRYPKSIIKIPNPNKKSLHFTQKPVEICEWLIKTYSNEGDTVLDFTMGSGSTGIGCLNTGRDFIGIEMNEEIFKIAGARIYDHVIDMMEISV